MVVLVALVGAKGSTEGKNDPVSVPGPAVPLGLVGSRDHRKCWPVCGPVQR